MAKDPICGMGVDENRAIKVTKDGKDYFFCSTPCKEKFITKSLLKNKLFVISSICLLIILASFFIPLLEPFRNIFLIYLKTIWWAVALGLFLGGIIDYYVPQEYISKITNLG